MCLFKLGISCKEISYLNIAIFKLTPTQWEQLICKVLYHLTNLMSWTWLFVCVAFQSFSFFIFLFFFVTDV